MIDYELAIDIIDIIIAASIVVMLSVAWYYIGYFLISLRKIPEAPHSDKYTKFAVLVPARNESKVIHNIINALKAQSYPKEYFDVWFITESEEDPTNKIAVKNHFHYFVRDQLTPDRRTKGYALDECIQYFKRENLIYDAYMIFDADNVMEKDFIKKMNDLRETGVQVGTGYRNFTNASMNWLTCCSATLFTYMNTFTSRGRTILFKKATLSGTGYYIDRQVIDDAGGWIFNGLTEDTELTGYCYYHDVCMRYYPIAMFYDEQTPSMRVAHSQQIRWVWGYFYDKEKVRKNKDKVNYHTLSKVRHNTAMFEYKTGIVPFAATMVVNFFLIVISIILAILSFWQSPAHTFDLWMHIIGQVIVLYSFYFFLALAVIIHDHKYLKFNVATTLWACTTYCFYFIMLLFAAIDGFIRPKKRKTWAPIKHTGQITNKAVDKAVKRKQRN